MREKLELKIIITVFIMLLVGVISAGFMTVFIEKSTLYEITQESSNTTASVITKNIERTMIENRPDLTRAIVNEIKGTVGVEDISIINSEGKEAFNNNTALDETDAIKKIISTNAPLIIKDTKKLTLYKPLKNDSSCNSCHSQEGSILGAVKVTMSIEKQYKKAMRSITVVIIATILGALLFSIVIWAMLRKMVILPIKMIEAASASLAEGDLSFDVDIKSRDEIGRLSRAIKESINALGRILRNIKNVAGRVPAVVDKVAKDSKKVVDGTQLETEAMSDISLSLEELNAAITEISEGTESLASSAEETAAAMNEIAASIGDVKAITHQLSESIETTSSSIEELSITIKEVANNADNLSSATDETLSAIEEMSVSVKEVEQNAKDSAKLSEKVMNDASTFGMTSVEKTLEGMKNIKISVEETNEFIKKLGGRSEEIGKILNVIDDITDQTALLALNAAILAAQAGEHGRGFAVVADEIKELAERTAFSTQEISSLIQSVQEDVLSTMKAMERGMKNVEEGFKLSKKASDALNQILESSKKSSEMAFSIERATAEQSKAIKLVKNSMENIKNMTATIAKATSEQTKGAALIVKATVKMRDNSLHVKKATDEQSANSQHISKAIGIVSDKSQIILQAIYEQRRGLSQIWDSMEKIKDLPKEDRDLAYSINDSLRSLLSDTELIDAEIKRFKFSEEKEKIKKA